MSRRKKPREPHDEKRFGGPPPERTPAQRWVLATQGILTELNGTSHLRVGGEPRPLCSNWSALRLRDHWNVRDAAEARRCLAWLFEEGHRFGYARRSGISADALLGWDLVRASCVAGWSYVAYLLELEEVWPCMVRAARLLQETFASWAEIGASYASGRRAWSEGDMPDEEMDELVARLTALGGGWDLPWDVDLSGEIPSPLDALSEIRVEARGAGGAFKTLAEAVEAHDAGLAGRIVVAAGTYEGSVRVSTALELVADGDVTIRCSDAAPIVAHHNVVLRGIRLEAGTDEDGEAMQAIWAGPHFVRAIDCTLRSERCGIYAGKNRAHVSAERCRVEHAKVNAFATENGANLVLVDCAVDAAEGSAVFASGIGLVFVAGLVVRGVAQPCVSIRGTNTISIRRLDVEGGGSNGLEILGDAEGTVEESVVRGCKGTGVLCGSSGEIHFAKCRFVDNGQNDLGVMTGHVHVEGSTIGGGDGCAVCTLAETALHLDGSEILGSKYPSMWLDGESTTVLTQTTVRAGDDFAVFLKSKASEGPALRAIGSTFVGVKKTAVVVRGAPEVVIVGGRIEGPEGALHVDEQTKATVSGTRIHGGGTVLVCVQKDADVAFADATLDASGGQALAVESGAVATLAGTTIRAPEGTALTVEGARVRATGSTWSGKTPANVDASSTVESVTADDVRERVTLDPTCEADDDEEHAEDGEEDDDEGVVDKS